MTITKFEIAGILIVEAYSLPQSLEPIEAYCEGVTGIIKTAQAVKDYPLPRIALLLAEETLSLAEEVIELQLEDQLPAETSSSESLAALLTHFGEIKTAADLALGDFKPVLKPEEEYTEEDYICQKLADSCPLEF